MLIKRKVAVKVIVTESFKQELVSRLRETLKEVELSQQQLELQGRGYLSELEGKDPEQAVVFRRRLERQEQKQQEVRSRLTDELDRAESLELETEYLQTTLDGYVEVQAGDNLNARLNSAEIVLRDGLVVEARGD